MRLRLSLRLPVRVQNRWTYAAAAYVCSSAFALAFGVWSGVSWGWLVGFIPAAIAAWVFPSAPRSRADMTLAGLCVVFFSFVALGLSTFVFALLEPATWDGAGSMIWTFVESAYAAILIMFFGSLLTLGLPWWVGIGVSWLFYTDDDLTHETALDEFMRTTLAKTEHEP